MGLSACKRGCAYYVSMLGGGGGIRQLLTLSDMWGGGGHPKHDMTILYGRGWVSFNIRCHYKNAFY